MDSSDFDSPSKKRSAKKGRRAKAEEAAQAARRSSPRSSPPPDSRADTTLGASIDAEELISTSNHIASQRDPTAPPRPSRRMGGWGDDNKPKSGRSSRPGTSQDIMENLDDMLDDISLETGERLKRSDSPENEDSDNDIPVIPDLDDTTEDATATIAMAPNVSVNRVATYKELDNDLLRTAAFQTLDNEIDLKVLTRSLAAEADVREDDKPWDWDRLFTEVSSELQTEWEENSDNINQEPPYTTTL